MGHDAHTAVGLKILMLGMGLRLSRRLEGHGGLCGLGLISGSEAVEV